MPLSVVPPLISFPSLDSPSSQGSPDQQHSPNQDAAKKSKKVSLSEYLQRKKIEKTVPNVSRSFHFKDTLFLNLNYP
jgi:hypothetical protein